MAEQKEISREIADGDRTNNYGAQDYKIKGKELCRTNRHSRANIPPLDFCPHWRSLVHLSLRERQRRDAQLYEIARRTTDINWCNVNTR